MINRETALLAFRNYTDHYNTDNILIQSKIVHTFHVADNCEQIARSLHLDEAEVDFAWLLGLLHDIGRFEQAERYGTFFDLYSVDHAELGADILFHDKLIDAFWQTDFPDSMAAVCETAIRVHNKLLLPADMDQCTKQFSEILRDADKADILRVITEVPFDQRSGTRKKKFRDAEQAGDDVMNCVYGHRCVPRDLVHTRFESHISHCCLAFELVYDCSKRIVLEQGHLDTLLQETDASGCQIWNDAETEQLRILKQEIRRCMNTVSNL